MQRQRGETAFVSQLRERVDLVHELRQLRATEEVAHHRSKSLGVDEFRRRHAIKIDIEQSHALFDKTLCPSKTNATLI